MPPLSLPVDAFREIAATPRSRTDTINVDLVSGRVSPDYKWGKQEDIIPLHTAMRDASVAVLEAIDYMPAWAKHAVAAAPRPLGVWLAMLDASGRVPHGRVSAWFLAKESAALAQELLDETPPAESTREGVASTDLDTGDLLKRLLDFVKDKGRQQAREEGMPNDIENYANLAAIELKASGATKIVDLLIEAGLLPVPADEKGREALRGRVRTAMKALDWKRLPKPAAVGEAQEGNLRGTVGLSRERKKDFLDDGLELPAGHQWCRECHVGVARIGDDRGCSWCRGDSDLRDKGRMLFEDDSNRETLRMYRQSSLEDFGSRVASAPGRSR